MEKKFVVLNNRAVLRITGDDAKIFLQGISTNDIFKVDAKHAVYSLILTPQGKFLFDFFIILHDDFLWLDVAQESLEELKQKLNIYKLRSKVVIEDISSEYRIAAIFNDEMLGRKSGEALPMAQGFGFIDPRHIALGVRAILLADEIEKLRIEEYKEQPFEFYEAIRIRAKIPENGKELLPEKSFPLQNGLDDLNAISYSKGCYVGQEVTARSKHRGATRKKLYVVSSDELIKNGTPIKAGSSLIGEMRSSVGNIGLAQMDIEAAEKNRAEKLDADGKFLRIIG